MIPSPAGCCPAAESAAVTWSVPQPLPAQPAPESCHWMARLGFEFCAGENVAVKGEVEPGAALEGPLIVSVKLLVMPMEAAACFAGSAALCAVSVTFAGEGRICGAVKCPPLSTVPQPLPAQPAPETAYTIVGSGFPAEEIPAANSAAAPSSTLAEEDKKFNAMSLVIPICALPLLEESAALVAVTVTSGSTGRSRGAVYSPAPLPVEIIVPTERSPPAIPSTAHMPPVFVVWLTDAVKLCVAPSSTAPDGGETVTVIVGGGGGGGGATGLTPPPPQPSVHAPAVRSTHRNTATTPVWRLVPHTHMHRGEATHPPPSAIIHWFRSHVVFASLGPSRSESKSKVLWHLGLMRT